MKKKVLTVCLVAVIAIMAVAGASLAYLTDTDEATNTFTLGNVSIELIETTYHREGNDNAGDTQIPDPTAIASGMEYVTDGHEIFTDAEIQANAAVMKRISQIAAPTLYPAEMLPSAPMSLTPAPMTLTSVSAFSFPPLPTMTLSKCPMAA